MTRETSNTRLWFFDSRSGAFTLASIAMAEILRDHLGISSETIEAKILEIDLRDGKIDGTFTLPPKTCKDCGRVSGPMSTACLYCGVASERIIPSRLLEPASDLNFRTHRRRTVGRCNSLIVAQPRTSLRACTG